MQSLPLPSPELAWRLQRRVLPQHTDHAGVMWHGTYLAWLEEARVEALATAGLAYSDLSRQGLELPVVHLAINYLAPLVHGDQVEVRSVVSPRRGLRFPWHSWFVTAEGDVAAEAAVDLVLVDFSAGPGQRRPLRRPPPNLTDALTALTKGPSKANSSGVL